jgi:predicted nuclease of restriction endonuclease-like (RecB) superfamily
MKKTSRTTKKATAVAPAADTYTDFAGDIAALLDEARRQAARSVNAILTATHWEIGRRIVEFEQEGKQRAEYGEQLLARLSQDLTARFGRGFGVDNLERMRSFFLTYPPEKICQSLTGESGDGEESEISASVMRKSLTPQILQTLSGQSISDYLTTLAQAFPLSWTHYIRLLSVKSPEARAFYETEALRGGWSVRQLDRQISTLFYERTALSKNKAAMLTKGAKPKPEDAVTAEEEIKDPYVLEFLGLKDEYSERELEEALIRHLESFLLELGNDFTFVARQKRIRVGDTWYRMDLLLYHRRLRCLVIIDLSVGKFTHADVGQMNLYVNYAGEHLTLPDENPPVGLILCAERDAAVAHYALGNLPNQIMAAEYQLTLPDPKQLEEEINKTRRMLESPARRAGLTPEGGE